jgi:CRISPR-associated protein Cmr4
MLTMRMMYLYALSAVHCGTGQSSDVIDLPVARELTTSWPIVPSATIKGVLRDECDPAHTTKTPERSAFWAAFGPDTANASETAGGLIFSDAFLLCLPVQSHRGTLAWVTCPWVLARWRRHHRDITTPPALATEPVDDAILVVTDSALADWPAGQPSSEDAPRTGSVYLKEYNLAASAGDASVKEIAGFIAARVFPDDKDWQAQFISHFGVVSTDLFTFLTRMATDVTARIRLDDNSKTVASGGLWYEETVPAEAIFAGPLFAAPRRGQTADSLYTTVAAPLPGPLQIGGNASTGRGIVEVRIDPAPPPAGGTSEGSTS